MFSEATKSKKIQPVVETTFPYTAQEDCICDLHAAAAATGVYWCYIGVSDGIVYTFSGYSNENYQIDHTFVLKKGSTASTVDVGNLNNISIRVRELS